MKIYTCPNCEQSSLCTRKGVMSSYEVDSDGEVVWYKLHIQVLDQLCDCPMQVKSLTLLHTKGGKEFLQYKYL